MRLKVEVELARGAPTTALDVLVLILAVRRGLARDVGKVSHKVVLLLLESGAALGQTVNLLVDGAHGLLGGLGLVLLALLHQGANLLGLGVTRGLELLDLGDDGTALVVEFKELLAIPRRLAICHGGIDGIGVLAQATTDGLAQIPRTVDLVAPGMGFLVELLGAVVGVTVTGNAAEAEAGGQNARALKDALVDAVTDLDTKAADLADGGERRG